MTAEQSWKVYPQAGAGRWMLLADKAENQTRCVSSVNSFKEPTCSYLDSLCCFFCSVSFISAEAFPSALLLLVLG